MSRKVLLPWKMGSDSATNLAKRLDILQIKPDESSKFVGRNSDIIINWGNSKWVPKARIGQMPTVLNRQSSVAKAVDKLTTLKQLENNGVAVPMFRETMPGAIKMMEQHELKRVFCRKILNGHSGQGIVIATKADEFVPAPLYVEGIAKKDEYRVHVMDGQVIDYIAKKRRNGAEADETYNSAIRSVNNGWVFARDGVALPENVKTEAIKSVAALGLDFGAVDICNELKTLDPYVLEINTSPGLEGTTLDKYVAAFQKKLKMEVSDHVKETIAEEEDEVPIYEAPRVDPEEEMYMRRYGMTKAQYFAAIEAYREAERNPARAFVNRLWR